MSNVFSFTGALGRDPELKYLPSGDALLSFSVACNTGFGDKRHTMWITCSVFGKRAETLNQYLTKGKHVFVSGELRQREYQGKDGTTKTSLEMNANVVDFIGGKQESGESVKPEPAAQIPGADNDYPFDDDVVF